jgi:iron(III) transport system ATP-binding protein
MRFEVRRLHDAYRYTTIYVTHDQSEAMTTADLIAVMNAGRIEQLGTPQEVYDAPRSEFVASFLGGSNILRGKALDATHISFAGTTIACVGAPMAAGSDAAVSVRNVFLGNARDYIVEARDGTQLRVTADPRESFAPNAIVWVTLPPDRCRALVG